MNDLSPRSRRAVQPLQGDGATVEVEDVAGPALRCPACRAAYIHHGRTTIFGRASEDGPTRAITIEPGAEIAHNRREQPSRACKSQQPP